MVSFEQMNLILEQLKHCESSEGNALQISNANIGALVSCEGAWDCFLFKHSGTGFTDRVEKARGLWYSAEELSFSDSSVSKKITKFYDPKEYGQENDRSPRIESYVKDFIPLKMGVIDLKKGKGPLMRKGIKMTGKELLDFRLLMLKRI